MFLATTKRLRQQLASLRARATGRSSAWSAFFFPASKANRENFHREPPPQISSSFAYGLRRADPPAVEIYSFELRDEDKHSQTMLYRNIAFGKIEVVRNPQVYVPFRKYYGTKTARETTVVQSPFSQTALELMLLVLMILPLARYACSRSSHAAFGSISIFIREPSIVAARSSA